MGMMAAITVLSAFALNAEEKKSSALVIPGTNYCGFGNKGGAPKSKMDAACKTRDESEGYAEPGVSKYNPGWGDDAVQKADRKLIKDSAKVITDKNAGMTEKAEAAAVGYYFTKKTIKDEAGENLRAGVQAIEDKLKKNKKTKQ
jgi:hypothetical protein